MVVGTWCMCDVMYGDDLNWPFAITWTTTRTEIREENTGNNSTSLFAARPNTRRHENVLSHHDAKYSLDGRTTGESTTRNDCKHLTKYDSAIRTKDSSFVSNLTPYKLLLSSLSVRYALCHNDARTILKRCRFGAFSPFRNDYWRKHFAPILNCIRVWSILHSETGRFKTRPDQLRPPVRIGSPRIASDHEKKT